MKNNKAFISSIVYLIYMVLACLVSVAVSSLVVLIINSIIPLKYSIASVIRAVVMLLTASAALYTIAYYDGYKNADYNYKDILIPAILAIIFHFVISIAVSFVPFICGGVRYLAGFISLGEDFKAGMNAGDIGYGICCVGFAFYAAIYAALINLGYYVGCCKRKIDRAELTGKQSGSMNEFHENE